MYKVSKVTQKTKKYSTESGKPDYHYTILQISKISPFAPEGETIFTISGGYFHSVEGHHELDTFKDAEVNLDDFEIDESEDEVTGRVYKWLI